MKKVAILMGSDSDLPVMQAAAHFLDQLGLPYEMSIISAHRTPQRLFEFAPKAREKGYGVIIAGAGGAAHLPGMLASLSSLPVIGVPIKSSNSIDGWDSVLSILQMPNGVPVATVALNGAKNAGILAAQILSVNDAKIAQKLDAFKLEMSEQVMAKVQRLDEEQADRHEAPKLRP